MDLEIGTHIVTSRKFYTHHGIYIGDNMVIHYAGLSEGIKKDCISKVSVQEFVGSGTLSIYKHEDLLFSNRLPAKEIVERAESRIGENRYNLLWNNCETFANWCTHGDEYSSQTDGKVERSFIKNAHPMLAVMPPISPISKINKVGRLLNKLFR